MKFLARVFRATVYEIEAENKEEAIKIAQEQFHQDKKEKKSWIKPEVQIEQK